MAIMAAMTLAAEGLAAQGPLLLVPQPRDARLDRSVVLVRGLSVPTPSDSADAFAARDLRQALQDAGVPIAREGGSARIQLLRASSTAAKGLMDRTHAEFTLDRELIELAKRIDVEQGWQLQLVVYDAVMSEKFENPDPPYGIIEEIQQHWLRLSSQQGRPCSEQEVAEVLQLAETILCALDPPLREGSASWRLRQAFTEGWLSKEQLGVFQRALEERRGHLDLTQLLGWRELLPALEPLVQSVVAATVPA